MSPRWLKLIMLAAIVAVLLEEVAGTKVLPTIGSCWSPQVELLSAYSTTDSAILSAHATSVHLSLICGSTSDTGESQQATYYNGPIFFRLNDEPDLRPLAVIEPGKLQASWKTVTIIAPAEQFTLRLYGEQAAAQFRKGASATELGRLTISRPAANRDAWLSGEAVALVSAFLLAVSAFASRAGISS
ncbi:uncharacterized protein LOC111266659 [Varroa jacobsoni]|uniref:Signal sequence receptor subunit delta n=1 Tax=Varroa destructor TaxID=109461 RepID=A0A7M7KJ58_VARDE|nr:uncharacterized protein LOC111253095 [Varroa destructor]XP_022700060.1 uncharacterized protein LOC111266659 [Varroa jacobsoni]